jgi:cell division transport system permease protein
MNNFKSLVQHTARSWGHHFLLQLGSLVVISSALTIVFSIFLFFSNLERTLISWGSAFDVNIFLKDNLKSEEISKIQGGIENLGYFKKIDFVDSKEASDKFFSKMSKYVPEFASEKDFANLIPSSFVGTIQKKLDIKEIENISANIEKISGVEDVSYGQEWLENLAAFLGSFKKVGWVISFVLVLGCFFVISFTVYAVLARRREEVEIFELCGATSAMIQKPFVVEAAALTLVSAVIAILLSQVILSLENQFLISQVKYLGFTNLFEFANPLQQFVFVLTSTFAGAGVALFCVKRINTGWAQAEREALK